MCSLCNDFYTDGASDFSNFSIKILVTQTKIIFPQSLLNISSPSSALSRISAAVTRPHQRQGAAKNIPPAKAEKNAVARPYNLQPARRVLANICFFTQIIFQTIFEPPPPHVLNLLVVPRIWSTAQFLTANDAINYPAMNNNDYICINHASPQSHDPEL